MKKIRTLKSDELYGLFNREFIRLLSGGNFLFEGGLGGHIRHIYENEDLSFSDIKQIFKLAASGKLEDATEKVDGQNIFITWNASIGELRAARNKGDIKTGGMNVSAVAQKFSGHEGSVQSAFVDGFNIINKALSGLDSQKLSNIFGANGDVWFSVEIVYPENSNIVNYGQNAIVFHKSGMTTTDTNIDANFNELTAHIDTMRQQLVGSSWKLFAPIMVQLNKLNNNEALSVAIAGLQQIQSSYQLSDGNTVGDLLDARIQKDILDQLSLPPEIHTELLAKLRGKQGVNAKKIKGMASVELQSKVDTLIKNQNKIMQEAVRPLEMIVHNFSVEVLKGIRSALELNPEQAIAKTRNQVQAAIDQVQSSGNANNIAILNKQLEKLKSVDNITSNLEGIVFNYNGQVYKLSGNFSPANRILGLTKYPTQ